MNYIVRYFETLSERRLSIKERLKRGFDILFSFCVLFFGFPIFLFIACCVKYSSKGPIFYRCKRVGKAGKVIYCYKFRTMVVDAQERLQMLLQTNPARQKEWEAYRKLQNDPRITKIGLFLRKTSLDELPQFFNVLRGELSVVGPRPVTEEEVMKKYKEKARIILSVKPGITGRWQVSGRNANTLEERALLEEKYAQEWTFFEDLWIICKTIPVMVARKGN